MSIDREAQPPALSDELFGSAHVVHPTTTHTLTTVWLHGRGSSGEEMADDLLTLSLSTGQSLREGLPGCRWVFPSSRRVWSTAFQEEMPAWFEAHSLTDIAAREDLQVGGLRESVLYIARLVEHEVELLEGNAEGLVLGGISQGAAVGLWALLSSRGQPGTRWGGFVGLSTWLPFAHHVEGFLASQTQHARPGQPAPEDEAVDEFARSMLPTHEAMMNQSHGTYTPVFLGHGTDDAYVDVGLGRQAAHVLTKFGMSVNWREYLGADGEGHWIKETEEVDDVHQFLDHRTTVS